ncbi:Uncharacterized protein LW94_12197 [Fusarium fujikuroi]|nr:Uncharacterized protein LW94_12197 [Fusarium fujikuroi]
MVDALSSTEAPVTTRNGVEYIKTTQPEDVSTNEPAGDEESFRGCLNNVVNICAKIDSTVLQVGSPFLGTIGAPDAAVVGTSLSVIGKLTSSNTEVAFDDKIGPLPPPRLVTSITPVAQSWGKLPSKPFSRWARDKLTSTT